MAQQLGRWGGDAAGVTATLNVITEGGRGAEERVQAIQSVRQQKVPAVQDTLAKVLNGTAPEPVMNAVISALGQFDGENVADLLLKRWKELTPGTRRTAAAQSLRTASASPPHPPRKIQSHAAGHTRSTAPPHSSTNN